MKAKNAYIDPHSPSKISGKSTAKGGLEASKMMNKAKVKGTTGIKNLLK